VLSVRDDGPGLTPAMRERIFDLFVQGPEMRAYTRGGWDRSHARAPPGRDAWRHRRRAQRRSGAGKRIHRPSADPPGLAGCIQRPLQRRGDRGASEAADPRRGRQRRCRRRACRAACATTATTCGPSTTGRARSSRRRSIGRTSCCSTSHAGVRRLRGRQADAHGAGLTATLVAVTGYGEAAIAVFRAMPDSTST